MLLDLIHIIIPVYDDAKVKRAILKSYIFLLLGTKLVGINLSFYLHLNFIKRYRSEVIVVNTDIILSREQHSQTGIVQSGITLTRMYMTKELPCSPVGTAIA